MHRKRDAHPAALLDGLDLALALGEERGPFDLFGLAASEKLFFVAVGVPDDERTTTVLHGEGDHDRGHPTIVPLRARLRGHATPARDHLESIPDRDEVVAYGQSGKQRVADRVEDGVVRDLEGGGEGEVGWVEERVAIGVYVDACCLVWPTCRDQDVQRRGRVVVDIDGEIE